MKPSPETSSLSTLLRESTRELHVRAERSGLMAELLNGRAERHGYALLLRNLLPAYVELERGLARHLHAPIFDGLAWTALFRAPAIARDLSEIAGKDWETSLALLPEGERYAARVAEAAEGNGERLLAHAYTRYLGDLSGGQVLKKLLGRTLALGADELAFYNFPMIADPARFKADFRASLEHAGGIVDRDAVLAEALAAFEHNIAVFEAVQASAKPGGVASR